MVHGCGGMLRNLLAQQSYLRRSYASFAIPMVIERTVKLIHNSFFYNFFGRVMVRGLMIYIQGS